MSKPGDREIVEVLARDVMGWGLVSSAGLCVARCGLDPYAVRTIWSDSEPSSFAPMWNPLESWADAGMVLEKLQMTVTPRKREGKWEAAMHYTVTTWSIADTPQRAISLAAYEWAKAKGAAK
jgi:Phage ABA sandwich domain/Protein of unknown function (DUF2591)